MRTEVIKADTIDVAVEKILVELAADTTSSRENAIYFDGWDGLGATSVLKAVAERLLVSNEPSTRSPGLEFEKIIYINCSKWESRRAMQRKMAEQLKLPNHVLHMFDKQNEQDDFNGLDQGSRSEIAQVTRAIYQSTQNCRFLVILHNGSNEEIDIFSFGLSLYGYANSKLLWTFQGRFRLDPKMKNNVKKSTTTHLLLLASRHGRDPQEHCSYLVYHEAVQVSCNKHGHEIIDPSSAAECVLYMLKQYCISSHVVDYDWPIHAGNYWVCNGNIPLVESDRAWKVVDVLQRESWLLNHDNHLNNDESKTLISSHLATSVERMKYCMWTETCGFVQSHLGIILENMLQHSHMLGVLKLSWCTFNFSSPPFLCCHNLRFLWLDHCQDLLTRRSAADTGNSTTMSRECFQSLWVLDIRYTDCDRILSAQMMDLMTQLRELNVMGAQNWDMSHLRGRLRNIRKLRVTNSLCFFNNNVFSEMQSMELLDFSGNTIRQGMTSLSWAESNSSLKTVTIDGSVGLEKISFRGCKELKKLFLKGLLGDYHVKGLDISGTRVKTLNLGEVKGSIPRDLILLGCEKLRAILWPKTFQGTGWSGVLRIDTRSTSTSSGGVEALDVHPHADQSLQKFKENGWQISLTDTRLLRSLSPVRSFFTYTHVHIDVCGASTVGHSNVQGTKPHTSTTMVSMYRDVLKDGPVETTMMWECPKILAESIGGRSTIRTCIIKVHAQRKKLLEDASCASTTSSFPDFIANEVRSLHVYNNSSITSIPEPPQGSNGWGKLLWCRVERCPKLNRIFILPKKLNRWEFRYLKTFWASQLLTARCIWDSPYPTSNLNFLHLDNCPSLIYVLPLSMSHVLHALGTLELVYCGELKEVFHLIPELQDTNMPWQFPHLRRIHLHELPKLQQVCGRRIWTPRLETIKIRGCWSLRHLPIVGSNYPRVGLNTKPPKVDCEKEWWDNLEWDGLEMDHHPSLYELSHSMYYKAQLPRVSLLR